MAKAAEWRKHAALLKEKPNMQEEEESGELMEDLADQLEALAREVCAEARNTMQRVTIFAQPVPCIPASTVESDIIGGPDA